jgi:hypothetical protein
VITFPIVCAVISVFVVMLLRDLGPIRIIFVAAVCNAFNFPVIHDGYFACIP